MPTVRDIVRDELDKRLKAPTFLESLGQQLIIQSHINNAVRSQLPTALSQNTGIISNFVQTHMASVLNQQHYFLDGLQQQKEHFKQASEQQLNTYKTAENDLTKRLNTHVNRLVTQTIKNMSNQKNVIQQLRDNIKKDVITEVNKDVNSRITTSCLVTGFLSASTAIAVSILMQPHL